MKDWKISLKYILKKKNVRFTAVRLRCSIETELLSHPMYN